MTGAEGEWLRVATERDDGAVRDGDLVALAPVLLAAARYLVRSEPDAADLVQATLEIAVRHRDQLRDPSRLRAWLLAIETREAFRLRRRLRSLVSLDGTVLEARPAARPARDVAVRLAVRSCPTGSGRPWCSTTWRACPVPRPPRRWT